jgi:hypothetical protein
MKKDENFLDCELRTVVNGLCYFVETSGFNRFVGQNRFILDSYRKIYTQENNCSVLV